jgi:hypothetical protein
MSFFGTVGKIGKAMAGAAVPGALVARALMKQGGGTRSNAPTASPYPNVGNTFTEPGAGGPNGPLPPVSAAGYPTVTLPDRDVAGNIGQMQDFAREGVQGYGQMLGEDFRKDVGNTLGNLNKMGALRSGAVEAGMGDLMSNYGRQVGAYSQMATRDAMGLGLQASQGTMDDYFKSRQLSGQETNDSFDRFYRQSEANRDQYNYDRELRERDRANKSKKKSGILGAVGGILGGVGGFMLGGPPGAMAGAGLGAKLGGSFRTRGMANPSDVTNYGNV